MSRRLNSSKRKLVRAKLPPLCAQCGATDELTIDHIIPRVYGGTNELHNLQTLCLGCNRLKAKAEVRYRNPQDNLLKGQQLAALRGTK
jgi:5-methylcytosine-specific restriction endonuclease McrA